MHADAKYSQALKNVIAAGKLGMLLMHAKARIEAETALNAARPGIKLQNARMLLQLTRVPPKKERTVAGL